MTWNHVFLILRCLTEQTFFVKEIISHPSVTVYFFINIIIGIVHKLRNGSDFKILESWIPLREESIGGISWFNVPFNET